MPAFVTGNRIPPVPEHTWLAVAALACMAGMACKEVMVTAPVVVLLFDRTFIAGSFRQSITEVVAPVCRVNLWLGAALVSQP